MEKILDKFLRYVAVDTMSDPDSPSQPSTQKQFNLLNLLCEELKAMGVENVSVDQYGYLMATIPSNIEKDVPAIGFIAHVDSSPDASGADIKPQVFENYDGGDIVINPEKGMKLSPADFPELRRYIGQTIVTTDGTTLLG
ncbi:MAG: peptidase T, partial [Bacteroidales bacterium]|nr:peptidase T [Bacteroidales bacterium]